MSTLARECSEIICHPANTIRANNVQFGFLRHVISVPCYDLIVARPGRDLDLALGERERLLSGGERQRSSLRAHYIVRHLF